jgi:Lipocalin-like domain
MNRKTAIFAVTFTGFFTLALATLRGPALYASQDRHSTTRVQDQLVGGWRLVSLETRGSDGTIHKADSTGLLVFTRDGHMSVQVMDRNPAPQSRAAPQQYSQGGYEASFGTYSVDASTHTFTFHVDGALVRSLTGKDLPRSFELSGKQLIVKSTHPEEHWKVTWEHF